MLTLHEEFVFDQRSLVLFVKADPPKFPEIPGQSVRIPVRIVAKEYEDSKFDSFARTVRSPVHNRLRMARTSFVKEVTSVEFE